jgi:hypothetical protein
MTRNLEARLDGSTPGKSRLSKSAHRLGGREFVEARDNSGHHAKPYGSYRSL